MIAFLAASSKKQSITHEDVNSIFLNRFSIHLIHEKLELFCI
jgi:hypothetical protein